MTRPDAAHPSPHASPHPLQPAPEGPWWAAFFDELFADVWLARRHPSTDVAFLVRELGLAPGARVYDQCCGVGRISAGLAARGVEVVGVDQSAAYVARARAAVASGNFVVADAFDYRVEPACDAAFNWWTSFGYDEDDARNARMLESAFESLRPGGRFALDYPNVSRLRAEFRPQSEDVVDTALGLVRVVRRARLDEARGMLVDAWTYELPGGERVTKGGETRLYSAGDLEAMMGRVGFRVCGRFGGAGGQALEANSQRCVLVAERAP